MSKIKDQRIIGLTGRLIVQIFTRYIGYTDSAVGAVVANKGFMQVFGTIGESGKLALNAQHVAIWGALQMVSSIVTRPFVSIIVDRWGRKPAMYVLLFSMLIVSVLEVFQT